MFLADAWLPQRPHQTTTLALTLQESRDTRRDPLQLYNITEQQTSTQHWTISVAVSTPRQPLNHTYVLWRLRATPDSKRVWTRN